MTKLRKILMVTITTVVLAGCGTGSYYSEPGSGVTPEGGVNQSGVAAQSVSLPDGRSVTCVFYYSDAVSCDWEHVRNV